MKSPYLAKMLKQLRIDGESFASQALKSTIHAAESSLPSEEASLMLKTRLGLSRSKYEGIARFAKNELGVKLLQPWKKMTAFRSKILPPFSPPNWDKGYLSSSVKLRDIVKCDVSRILELDEVIKTVTSLKSERINCTLFITAGPDSATGFTHYNQPGIVGKDDSLLSEHSMSLLLRSENGVEMWRNPNPQSDMFCRIRSMNWTKETEKLTKEMFDNFFEEVDEINQNPVVVSAAGKKIEIHLSALYTLIDGKAANAIVGNRNTHSCPVCIAGSDGRIGPSFFHSQLNAVEWLIRQSAKKAVKGYPAMSHPEVKAEARKIADKLEEHFKMQINRPKIGGSGSSNNGNMARRLLAQPKVFAAILNIDAAILENLRLISSLSLSSRKLDAKKVAELYSNLETGILQTFPFIKMLPPCIHKYKHLAEFADKLVSYFIDYLALIKNVFIFAAICVEFR